MNKQVLLYCKPSLMMVSDRNPSQTRLGKSRLYWQATRRLGSQEAWPLAKPTADKPALGSLGSRAPLGLLLSPSVGSGCCNKTPQSGGLKQQTYIFSQFCRLEVQDQSPARLSSGESPLSGLPQPPPGSVLTWYFLLCAHGDLALALIPLYIIP